MFKKLLKTEIERRKFQNRHKLNKITCRGLTDVSGHKQSLSFPKDEFQFLNDHHEEKRAL